MDRGDLTNLTAFVAVADQRSFRAAASRLGVTPSALSHSMRQLEERLGMRLLHRTTRSVSLTDAGLRLLERLRPAIDQIAGALEDLNQERQRPMGRLRIYAIQLAAAAVVAPVLGTLLVDVSRESTLSSRCGEAPIDIVAKGFDAGIGPPRPGAGRHDCRSGDGAHEGRRRRCADLFCAAASAAHARRSRPAQLHSISFGWRRRRIGMAVRAESQIAADFGGWARDGQQCLSGCSRGG